MMTKQRYIHYSLNVVFCLPLYIHDRVENILKYILFYVHDIKVMAEKIEIRKLPENILLYLIVRQIKTRNLCLPDWKPNIISPYSDTISYNSSPERRGGTTSFSTLLTKKSFFFFLYL